MQVNGDAFISRTYDNGDDFKRLNFNVSEVSSSAPWVKVSYQLLSNLHTRCGKRSLLNTLAQHIFMWVTQIESFLQRSKLLLRFCDDLAFATGS